MSVELPEARILAEQMDRELRGKRVWASLLKDCDTFQRAGAVTLDSRAFRRLACGQVESVTAPSGAVRMALDNGMSLLLALGAGGRLSYHRPGEPVREKFHLRTDFCDGSVLTVRLAGPGSIRALAAEELRGPPAPEEADALIPGEEGTFTLRRLSRLLEGRDGTVTSALSGRNPAIAGLGPDASQDILYRARIHPGRPAASLRLQERRALFDAISHVVHERACLGGTEDFVDLHGKHGGYTAAMGPHMEGRSCPVCRSTIAAVEVEGETSFVCPGCQPAIPRERTPRPHAVAARPRPGIPRRVFPRPAVRTSGSPPRHRHRA